MTTHARATATTEASSLPAPTLQRACASTAGLSDKCPSCAAEEQLGVQPKLRINPPGDRWEQEADRIATEVVSEPRPLMRGPLPITPLVQRQPIEEDQDEDLQAKRTLQRQPAEEQEELQPKLALQRQPTEEEKEEELQAKLAVQRQPVAGEEELQAKPAGRIGPADGAATRAAAVVASGGRPLSPAERAFFEPRLGRDLSPVRIHDDARAGAAATGINARAYTLRNHVVFAPGAYNSRSTDGRRLIAHELVHTMQQGASGGRAPLLLQRAVTYWALDNIPGLASPGTRTHRHVQHNLGVEARAAQALYAEMPVPGGSEHDNRGYVDLYRSDTEAPIGVEFDGGEPKFLHIRRRRAPTSTSRGTPQDTGPQVNGGPLDRNENVRFAAPAGRRGASACDRLEWPSGSGRRGICRMEAGTAPAKIKIGEIKPALSGDSILGTDQVERYTKAISTLSEQVSNYATANEALIRPKGASWRPSVSPLTGLSLGVLAPSREGKGPVKASEYLGGWRAASATECVTCCRKASDH